MTRKYHEAIAEMIEDIFRFEGYAGINLTREVADVLENAYQREEALQTEEVDEIPPCGEGEPRTR